MTNAEREKRLAAIRERLRRANPRTWRQRWAMSFTEADNLLFCAADDLDFLLAELDYLEVPLHDLLAEHTSYADGFRAGLEEGARRESEKLFQVTFPNPNLSPAEQESLREAVRQAMKGVSAQNFLVLPQGVETLDLHAQAQQEALPHA